MNEKENKNFLTRPLPPMSPAKQTLLYAALGAGIGATIEAGWQTVANWVSKSKHSLSKSEIVTFAVEMGVISAFIGYYMAKGEAKTHDVKVENVKLQNKIANLESEQSNAAKSFVKHVTQPKADQEHQQTR